MIRVKALVPLAFKVQEDNGINLGSEGWYLIVILS